MFRCLRPCFHFFPKLFFTVTAFEEFTSLAWLSTRSRTAKYQISTEAQCTETLKLWFDMVFQLSDLSIIHKPASRVMLNPPRVCVSQAPVSVHILSNDVHKSNPGHLQSSSDWITLFIASYEFSSQPPRPLSTSSRWNATTIQGVNCCVSIGESHWCVWCGLCVQHLMTVVRWWWW